MRADAYDPVLYDPAQSPDALLAYIKAADTRRGASFVVRLPSRSKKEAQA